jgi:hypothetical protein
MDGVFSRRIPAYAASECLSLEAVVELGFLGCFRLAALPDRGGLGSQRHAVVRGGLFGCRLGFGKCPVERGDGRRLALVLAAP